MAIGTALIIGGGPGISASCTRLFSEQGMQVALAARKPEKSAMVRLQTDHGAALYQCDASDPESVKHLFERVISDHGRISLVIHNIDGRSPDIFRKAITEAEPELALSVLKNSAYSAFLVGQQAATHMLAQELDDTGQRGTIIYMRAGDAGYDHTVGVAGLLMGGGHGALVRSYGLGADQLLSLTTVLANGTVVVAPGGWCIFGRRKATCGRGHDPCRGHRA